MLVSLQPQRKNSTHSRILQTPSSFQKLSMMLPQTHMMVKLELHPRKGHEGPKGEEVQPVLLSSQHMRVGGLHHASAALSPGKSPSNPSYRSATGPIWMSAENIHPPPDLICRPLTFRNRASSTLQTPHFIYFFQYPY
jgi:hypothetical protein